MKKNNIWKLASLALAMFAFGFTSCEEEEPTEVAKNEAAAVEGFVTYSNTIADTEGAVAKNATIVVNYSYKLNINGEEVVVTLSEQAQTNRNGWYSVKLNVPTGKTADYTIVATFVTADKAKDVGSSSTVGDCLFKKTATGTVSYGDVVKENIALANEGLVNDGYGK